MAKAFINDTTLTNIGNAIRSVNGSSDLMLPSAMPDVIKTLGNGLYVWKKHNVEFVQGAATTVTLQNDGTSINLYTIDNLYLKDDLTVGIQGDVAKTVAISSLLENTVVGGMNPIYYAYGEDGFVYAYSRCSSDGTAITISNPVTAGKGEFINYVVSDNPNAFPDGDVHSDGFFYEVFDGSGAYVWKKYETETISYPQTTLTFTQQNVGRTPATLKVTCPDIDLTQVDASFFNGVSGTVQSTNQSYIFNDGVLTIESSTNLSFTYDASTTSIYIDTSWGDITWGSTTIPAGETVRYIYSNFVVSDNISAYPNGGTQGGYWYELYVAPFGRIVTWAGGTDEEIAAMVEAADQGVINLSDYWAVGDIRTVQLSAMSATGVGESHAAQQVDLVLMHAGGYKLADGSTCNFVVGQKDALAEKGYMNSGMTNSGSWDGSARRAWCNNEYKNAMPASLSPIFKQFKTITTETYNGTTLKTSLDYFALPAAKEVFGGSATSAGADTNYSNLTEFNALFQFDWYKTASNRIKKLGISGSANSWWERSPSYNLSYAFCNVDSGGGRGHISADYNNGLAPFGCI